MRKEKYLRQKSVSSRTCSYKYFALLLALLLVVGSAVGGTVAWLIADTDPVVNTFTYGDINLKLEETKTDEKGNPVDENGDGNPDKTTSNQYEMIPGEEYLKDPAVTILAGNEACWLFVKLEEKGGVDIQNSDGSNSSYDFDDYLDYAVAAGWTQLLDAEGNPEEGIYFRKVEEDTDDTEVTYDILEGNKIYVPGTVTKDMLNALDNNGQSVDTATYPSLSVTAYAVQYRGFEAEVSDEATESTPEQLNAAALLAWQAVEAQNTTVTP